MNDMRVGQRVITVWKGGKGNDPNHPHQVWLEVNHGDFEGTKQAFAFARAKLPEVMVEEILGFYDNAQYTFITRLIFRSYEVPSNGAQVEIDAFGQRFVYVDSVDQAFAFAKKDQEVYLAAQSLLNAK